MLKGHLPRVHISPSILVYEDNLTCYFITEQVTGTFKTQIDWLPLNSGSVRPTQGRTVMIAQVYLELYIYIYIYVCMYVYIYIYIYMVGPGLS